MYKDAGIVFQNRLKRRELPLTFAEFPFEEEEEEEKNMVCSMYFKPISSSFTSCCSVSDAGLWNQSREKWWFHPPRKKVRSVHLLWPWVSVWHPDTWTCDNLHGGFSAVSTDMVAFEKRKEKKRSEAQRSSLLQIKVLISLCSFVLKD